MKKLMIYLLLSVASLTTLKAQSELPTDSIRHTTKTGIKQFGDFLLDMRLMQATMIKLPKLDFTLTDNAKDYNALFRLPESSIYSQEQIGSSYSLGLNDFSSFGQTETFRKSTFKLNNGWQFSTYGNYNADGWKIPQRSVLPWEKNNFSGGFELKSANKAFGIRIEVRQGQNYPY